MTLFIYPEKPIINLLPNTYRPFYGAYPFVYPFQAEAVQPILDGKDILVRAGTGTGKTEAVLAPAVEKVIQNNHKIKILYIVPTRALALDLMRRFRYMLSSRLNIVLSLRTSDIKNINNTKTDILVTTPESLDVMIGSPNRDIKSFLLKIRIIIIDEAHIFVNQYRGFQLNCLLKRLQLRIKFHIQKIALSATMETFGCVIDFFDFNFKNVQLEYSSQRKIIPHLVHLQNEEEELVTLLNDMGQKWGYNKILLFTNSRGKCDRLFEILSNNDKSIFKDVAGLHYSNINTKKRMLVEKKFQKLNKGLCISTSTLELGIDVGDIDGVILYEPPDSVSSFKQRIGRSNRRGKSTHFWGICRGENPGEQLVQFMALLNLSRKERIEAQNTKNLNSVLIQQILSCLYEKKRVSKASITGLFTDKTMILDNIFPELIKKKWLKEEKYKILTGGQKYAKALIKRKIWSNFPVEEILYILEVNKEAIADIPRSVVKQFKQGDIVYLAGRRVKIVQIADNENSQGKKSVVIAETTRESVTKNIFWFGSGFRISRELAEEIKNVLVEKDKPDDSGLFFRTTNLLTEIKKEVKSGVSLANGFKLSKSETGFYRYWTWLGSNGNLILNQAVEHYYNLCRQNNDFKNIEYSGYLQPEDEPFYSEFDAVSITCSRKIDFSELILPVTREQFKEWTSANLKLVSQLFSLNSFSQFLPKLLFIDELSSFLYDEQLAEIYADLE